MRGVAVSAIEFAAEVDRILHAEADPLPAGRRMDVRGVAGEKHPPTAVGGCLQRARALRPPEVPGEVWLDATTTAWS